MRLQVRPLVLAAVAFGAAGGSVWADDQQHRLSPSPLNAPSASSSFFHSYLAPRMSSKLSSSRAAVQTEFGTPNVNPWTRATEDTEDQVQRGAIRATKSALKKYALERLNLTGWSLPLGGGGEARGAAAFRTESGGMRLRFGWSHRAPTAEILLPVDSGRVAVSANVLGRVGASFEMPNGRLRVGAYVDPHDDSAIASLSLSF